MSDHSRTPGYPLLLILMIGLVVAAFVAAGSQDRKREPSYGEFIAQVEQRRGTRAVAGGLFRVSQRR